MVNLGFGTRDNCPTSRTPPSLFKCPLQESHILTPAQVAEGIEELTEVLETEMAATQGHAPFQGVAYLQAA